MTLSVRSRRAIAAFISIGGTAVALAAHAQQATPPRWRGTIDLTIGGENATDDASFGSVSGLTTDAVGRVFVADRQDNQIRVFAPAGALIEKLGRVGSGPLEFKRLATITIGPDGLLWARDEGNARMLAFNVSTSPFTNARTVPLKTFTGGSRLTPVFESTGIMVDESITFDKKLDAFRPVRLRINGAGDILRADTIPVPEGAFAGVHKVTKVQKDAAGNTVGVASSSVSQPFGPEWLKAYGPGGLRAEAISSRYEVGVYGADGRLVRTLRRTVPPVRLSAREVKAGETELKDEVRFHKLTRSAIPFGIPTNKPPITTLSWSLDGALWVQRSTADGRPSESDVYDASGKWIAIAEWPSSIGLAAGRYLMSGKTMLATTRDSSDVESVVRLRFR